MYPATEPSRYGDNGRVSRTALVCVSKGALRQPEMVPKQPQHLPAPLKLHLFGGRSRPCLPISVVLYVPREGSARRVGQRTLALRHSCRVAPLRSRLSTHSPDRTSRGSWNEGGEDGRFPRTAGGQGRAAGRGRMTRSSSPATVRACHPPSFRWQERGLSDWFKGSQANHVTDRSP